MQSKNPGHAAARQALKLRRRPTGEWEVYATIHGTQVARWWTITDDLKLWYETHFPGIPIIPFTQED